MISTHSSRATFLTCQQLYQYKYIACMRPQQTAALRTGDVVHKALEVLLVRDLDDAIAVVADHTTDRFLRAKLAQVIAGYHYRWQDSGLQVLAVEQQFEIQHKKLPGVLLSGKIDGIVKGSDGVEGIEHKTKSSDIGAGTSYWEKLVLDAQISEYILASRHLGYDTSSCIYDVLRIPGLDRQLATPKDKRKYRKKDNALYAGQRAVDETVEEYAARICNEIAGNPDKYYRRQRIVRLRGDLEEYEANRDLVIRQTLECLHYEKWVKNTGACDRYNRSCAYLGVCSGQESLTDNPRFTKTVAHPELA